MSESLLPQSVDEDEWIILFEFPNLDLLAYSVTIFNETGSENISESRSIQHLPGIFDHRIEWMNLKNIYKTMTSYVWCWYIPNWWLNIWLMCWKYANIVIPKCIIINYFIDNCYVVVKFPNFRAIFCLFPMASTFHIMNSSSSRMVDT